MSETTTVCKCGHVEEAHEVDGCNHCYCGNFRAVRGGPPAPDAPTDEDVARAFHEAYERLASTFDYATREASAKPWADVPEANRRLMVATVAEVRALLAAGTPQPTATVRDAVLRSAIPQLCEDCAAGNEPDLAYIGQRPWLWLHRATRERPQERACKASNVRSLLVVPPPPDTAAAPTEADKVAHVLTYALDRYERAALELDEAKVALVEELRVSRDLRGRGLRETARAVGCSAAALSVMERGVWMYPLAALVARHLITVEARNVGQI
jgi:hypothetical protein